MNTLNRELKLVLAAAVLFLLGGSGLWAGDPDPTPLFRRGFTVIPTPHEVDLSGEELPLTSDWSVDPGNLGDDDIAVRSLLRDLKDFYGLALRLGPTRNHVIRLQARPGLVAVETKEELADQAYTLTISPDTIEVNGNSPVGVFYGVQTLLQLPKVSRQGKLLLPVGKITDWPDLQYRFLHWDTKHHQDRIETLKRYLDWSARFKVNMIGFELEDKFSYPSHPVIGAPGAFTPEQLQEIVDYGLERHIQVVPQVQAPAHMAYVLKHPEFAHLRSDGSNYQACLCDERTYDLIFDMFQDLIDATQGVDFFFVSTDEVYYAGICEKCRRPYNLENRSLAWAEFVQRAHQFLKSKGRKVLIWLEYPLLPEHVSKLPADIIDGVLGNSYMPPLMSFVARRRYIEEERKIGMRQLVYVSMQGEEYLFPDHLDSDQGPGNLSGAFRTIVTDSQEGDPIGIYGAAWDDSGLHNETFWLGWSAVAQWGWSVGTPSVAQHVSEFMNIYFGPDVRAMAEIYAGLQEQARFFQTSWDRVPSRVRGLGYGSSQGKHPVVRLDLTLPQPALPHPKGLDVVPVYVGRYQAWIERAQLLGAKAAAIQLKLHENIALADRNQYNLEVLSALLDFTRHHEDLIVGMHDIERTLGEAAQAARSYRPQAAVEALVSAYARAATIVRERRDTYERLKNIYEKSRYPKGLSLPGKDFVHIMDDVKDHWADRRPDLTFMIAPEESIDLEGWMEKLSGIILDYAEANSLPVADISVELKRWEQ